MHYDCRANKGKQKHTSPNRYNNNKNMRLCDEKRIGRTSNKLRTGCSIWIEQMFILFFRFAFRLSERGAYAFSWRKTANKNWLEHIVGYAGNIFLWCFQSVRTIRCYSINLEKYWQNTPFFLFSARTTHSPSPPEDNVQKICYRNNIRCMVLIAPYR